MKGGGMLENLYIFIFIVGIIGAFVLGGWVTLTYFKPEKPPKPPSKPNADIHPTGWGPGPWGPDPWGPDSQHHKQPIPDPGPGPAPKPAPPDNFKPVLTLMSANYDGVGREIKLDYKILPSGSVPPSKTFTIEYVVMYKGKRADDNGIPQEEPLSESEMSGLQQSSLIDVVGVPSDAVARDLSVSAQIHYRENGTLNSGSVGVPVTIDVS
jgi:hypothetical protein